MVLASMADRMAAALGCPHSALSAGGERAPSAPFASMNRAGGVPAPAGDGSGGGDLSFVSLVSKVVNASFYLG